MMNLNEFSEANSEFSHAVQMDINHIALKNILLAKSIYQLAIHMKGNAQICYRFDVKCQIWRHASSLCFIAVLASSKLYSIAHKLLWSRHYDQCHCDGKIQVSCGFNFEQIWRQYNVHFETYCFG